MKTMRQPKKNTKRITHTQAGPSNNVIFLRETTAHNTLWIPLAWWLHCRPPSDKEGMGGRDKWWRAKMGGGREREREREREGKTGEKGRREGCFCGWFFFTPFTPPFFAIDTLLNQHVFHSPTHTSHHPHPSFPSTPPHPTPPLLSSLASAPLFGVCGWWHPASSPATPCTLQTPPSLSLSVLCGSYEYPRPIPRYFIFITSLACRHKCRALKETHTHTHTPPHETPAISSH